MMNERVQILGRLTTTIRSKLTEMKNADQVNGSENAFLYYSPHAVFLHHPIFLSRYQEDRQEHL